MGTFNYIVPTYPTHQSSCLFSKHSIVDEYKNSQSESSGQSGKKQKIQKAQQRKFFTLLASVGYVIPSLRLLSA